ncbi:MAG: regulatory protein RecX [Bacteroidales bacterium]|nr:regulatory protein RecX [Bacteroidales bacterium]
MIQRKTVTPQQALVRLEEQCARAEHSTGELRLKMRRWGITPSDADKIIDSLVSRHFVDDSRFAAAYVRDKVEYGGWGRRKIALGLYQKGVARDIISAALDEIDSDRYIERLREIIDRKRRATAEADTYEGRTRIYRHAASRGFEPDLIAKVLREIKKPD